MGTLHIVGTVCSYSCHNIYVFVSSVHVLLSCAFNSEASSEKLQMDCVNIKKKNCLVW